MFIEWTVIFADETILIVFIDYGNSETKPANEIYPIQESLTYLPAMVVACTLAEVNFSLLSNQSYFYLCVIVIST